MGTLYSGRYVEVGMFSYVLDPQRFTVLLVHVWLSRKIRLMYVERITVNMHLMFVRWYVMIFDTYIMTC